MTKQKQGIEQSSRQKICFVISPIGDANTSERLRSDQVFKHMIRPIVEEFGYRPERADLLSSPGMITNQIMDYLFNSELVVADLTDHNPNVFYELALRHAFAKPVIPIIKEGQKIPFDNSQIRTLFYNHNDLDSVEECKQGLKEHIESIENGNTRFSNPVTNTVELEKLKESSNPEVRQTGEILSALALLQEEVKSIKSPMRSNSQSTYSVISFLLRRLNDSLMNITRLQTALSNEGINEAAQNREIYNYIADTDKSLRAMNRALLDLIERSGELDSEERLRLARRFQMIQEVPF